MSGETSLQASGRTILQIVNNLLIDDGMNFTESQYYALNRIYLYTQELLALLEKPIINHVRKVLIELVTPILGYAQMLSEGWIGRIEAHQCQHVREISEQATMMRQLLLHPNKSLEQAVFTYADSM